MSYSMELIIINVLMTLVGINSFIFGEAIAVVLPRLSKHLDKKPFNCRPCLTFHLCWIGIAVIAGIFQSWNIFISGVVTAFIIFALVKYLDSKRVTE